MNTQGTIESFIHNSMDLPSCDKAVWHRSEIDRINSDGIRVKSTIKVDDCFLEILGYSSAIVTCWHLPVKEESVTVNIAESTVDVMAKFEAPYNQFESQNPESLKLQNYTILEPDDKKLVGMSKRLFYPRDFMLDISSSNFIPLKEGVEYIYEEPSTKQLDIYRAINRLWGTTDEAYKRQIAFSKYILIYDIKTLTVTTGDTLLFTARKEPRSNWKTFTPEATLLEDGFTFSVEIK